MSYKGVLASQHNNLYAANGVGVVLAEHGMLDAARDVFVIVQVGCNVNIQQTGGCAAATCSLHHKRGEC